MAMDLKARAAFIRGMMKGMEFDPASQNGKIIAEMMDLLEEMAAAVVDHDAALDEMNEELAALEEDVDAVCDDLYGEDDADDTDDDDAMYEVTCPKCGTVTPVDEQTLLGEELVCPKCGTAFDVELESADDEPTDPIFVMPEDIKG